MTGELFLSLRGRTDQRHTPRSQESSARGRRSPQRGKGMAKKSVARRVARKSAGEIPPASKADLDRLRAAQEGDIDTREIPERKVFHRLKRDAIGRLPGRRGKR